MLIGANLVSRLLAGIRFSSFAQRRSKRVSLLLGRSHHWPIAQGPPLTEVGRYAPVPTWWREGQLPAVQNNYSRRSARCASMMVRTNMALGLRARRQIPTEFAITLTQD